MLVLNQTKHRNLTFQTVTVYLITCSKCPHQLSHKLEDLIKLSTALLMEFGGRLSHIVSKTLFRSSLVFGLGWNVLKWLVAFKHSSLDMIIKRIKVWWVQLFFSDEVTAVADNPVFSQLCRMCRCFVLVVANQISVQCWDFYVDVCRLWDLAISRHVSCKSEK